MKTWIITGYAGWSDYDGPCDDNIHKEITVDDFFTEDDIYAALFNHYKKYRSTAFDIKLKEDINEK